MLSSNGLETAKLQHLKVTRPGHHLPGGHRISLQVAPYKGPPDFLWDFSEQSWYVNDPQLRAKSGLKSPI